MKTKQFYKIAAIVLLVLNIGLVTFFVLNKKRHHQPGHLKAIKMLNLNESQADEFKSLAEAHHQSMVEINKEQAELLTKHFKSLYDLPNSPNAGDLTFYSDLEVKKINITYDHFKDVRGILDKEQQVYYQEFIEKTVQKALGNKGGRKHPKK
ncbi:MAG: hypothetical protein AB8B72_01400 [Crocinitomicaceae bacterium]